MRPEQPIQQALHPVRYADVMMSEATPFDGIVERLMAVERYGNGSDREPHRAGGVLTLGGLVSLTRSLPGNLQQWGEAA